MRGCSPRGGVHGCSQGGMYMVAPRGGMHGCSGGACMVALGGHAWLLLGGACVGYDDTQRYSQ